MGTTTNEKISQEAEPTLQLEKPLLPIDEYAAREGISRELVEECGELGIVQLRKYKGKTFVVDVPLSPYYHTPEITAEPTQPIDKTAQANNISKSAQKIIPDVPKTTDETKEKLELAEITQDNGIEFGLLAAQVKSKRIWQIAALVSIVLLFATLFGNLWLYMNRKTQAYRLGLAHAEIQKAYNNSIQLKQQIEILQNELSNSRAEVGRLQNELDNFRAEAGRLQNQLDSSRAEVRRLQNQLDSSRAEVGLLQNQLDTSRAEVGLLQNQLDTSKAEVRTIRNELARVKQNLKTIQERNAKAVERLNKQIQKLSDQPAN